MAISIHQALCKGCGKCVGACPFSAITMYKKKAILGEACTSCGACIASCPFGAIEAADAAQAITDISAYRGVWVFAEQRDGEVMDVVPELLGEGRRLADEIGTQLCAVLLGSELSEDMQRQLIVNGADTVYLADDPALLHYTTDAYSKVICAAVQEFKPEIMLFGATHIGRDLAPSLAVGCSTGLTADCTKLDIDPEDHKLMQTRPAFGGNLMATILCQNHRPQMSTVRPGVMQKAVPDPKRSGEVVSLPVNLAPEEIRTRVIEVVNAVKSFVKLNDAQVIVSGGRGLGDPKGFQLLQKLADRLGGVVAASRAAVDAGWADHALQVGQTGDHCKAPVVFRLRYFRRYSARCRHAKQRLYYRHQLQ